MNINMFLGYENILIIMVIVWMIILTKIFKKG
jgi:hypothetical protein